MKIKVGVHPVSPVPGRLVDMPFHLKSLYQIKVTLSLRRSVLKLNFLLFRDYS